jgi:protein TonB
MPGLADVYSAGEIARVAGVRPSEVRALVHAGIIRPLSAGYFTGNDAVTAIRALTGAGERPLFRPAVGMRREAGLPLTMSGTAHAVMVLVIGLMTSAGANHTPSSIEDDHTHLRMVFLVSPGPGGGGGGGGVKALTPPPAAERKGVEKLRSPIAAHHPPARLAAHPTPPPRIDPPPTVRQPDPPPVQKAGAIQPVFAPVVPAAPDPRDRVGIPWHAAAPAENDSHGTGSDGGVGSGHGTGLGEGQGSGIGDGSGGGTGGGPYRPGVGITPPSIQREVRPDYTDEGRRRAVEGDVVLEIVVGADGSVGSVKLLQGLGAGLDQRAIEAVRQWRFNPAKRYGTPVDVVVEVAVEFKLR